MTEKHQIIQDSDMGLDESEIPETDEPLFIQLSPEAMAFAEQHYPGTMQAIAECEALMQALVEILKEENAKGDDHG